MNLKRIYDIKREFASRSDIKDLSDMIQTSNPSLNTETGSDRSIIINTENGLDSIIESVDKSIAVWAGCEIPFPVNLIYNLFPLSESSCLLKI